MCNYYDEDELDEEVEDNSAEQRHAVIYEEQQYNPPGNWR